MVHVPDLVKLEREDRTLYIDPEAPNWAILNREGAEILELCRTSGEEEIARRLSEKWGKPYSETLRAVRPFLEALREIDLLREEPSDETYPGRGAALAPMRLRELWIYTNRSCNLSCTHCFLGDWETRRELTPREIQRVLEEGRALGVERFYFTGGEPFLRRDILELIRYVTEDLKSELVILTNGTLLTGRLLEGLREVRTARLAIQVSLEGPREEINDAVRGKGSFRKAVEGIRNLIRIGMTPVVATVLTRANAGTIEEMPAFLASLGVRHFHVHWLYREGRAKERGEEFDLPPRELAEVMERLKRKAREHRVTLDNLESLRMRVETKRGRKNDLCHSCYEMLSVDSDGAVYPCAPFTGREEFRLGTLRDESLERLWRGSGKAAEIRAATVAEKEACSLCPLRHLCGGGCFFRSYLSSPGEEKGLLAKDPYCEVYRTLVEGLLWEMGENGRAGKEGPRVLAHMGSTPPRCASCHTKALQLEWEVGTFPCSCFLAADSRKDGVLKGRKPMAACFNDLAPEYDRWGSIPLGRAYVEAAKKEAFRMLGAGRGLAVLEVGCGTGNYLLPLAAMGAAVTGVDSSEAMLRVAHRKAQDSGLSIRLEHAYAEDLPFGEGTFDAVLSLNLLEFVEDPPAAVGEMLRVLKGGGTLVVGVLNRWSLWGLTQRLKKPFMGEDRAYYRGKFFSEEELTALLRGACGRGKEIEVLRAVFFPPINSSLLLRLWEKGAEEGRPWALPGALLIARLVK
jgi:radical SAM protein with 4Fe4S-binding SPASM domain